jgi:catechol 2,3-dioxygenase-like lactoylglutathione lyase family enzyme
MMIDAIDHVNLVVRDLEAMKRFYRDVLGFRVTKEVTISGNWIGEIVGLRDVVADVVYLDPAAGPRVELIYYRQPQASQPKNVSAANAPGLRHVAFRVSDIDEAVRKLAQAGVKTRSAVATVPQDQVTYAGGIRKRLVYFEDPEGNILELCEYK